MDLKQFQDTLLTLTSMLRQNGFYANPNRFQTHVFGKLVDYESHLPIIMSRIEEDIKEEQQSTKIAFDSMKADEEIEDKIVKQGLDAFERLMLDLSDFYVYTRMFLDTLTITIKLTFKNNGNKNAYLMKNTLRCLLNEEALNIYKQEISLEFFNGLEQHLAWVKGFRESRDGLVHGYHHFVFTDTKQGEAGYEIMDLQKGSWGTETVKGIMSELNIHINDLTELIKYLSSELPKVT